MSRAYSFMYIQTDIHLINTDKLLIFLIHNYKIKFELTFVKQFFEDYSINLLRDAFMTFTDEIFLLFIMFEVNITIKKMERNMIIN
jgi:hypothetical protein